MTDLAASEAPDTRSTTLDPNAAPGVSGGGAPKTLETEDEPKKEPASLRDVIADEAKKDSEAREKPDDDAKPAADEEDGEAKGEKDEKAKADAKPEEKGEADDEVKGKPDRNEDGKFKAKDTKEPERSNDYQPPKNFLPDSREKWTNVPRPVQRDIENMEREHQAQVTQLREATERYEAIKPFDELAKSNGRDLRESLEKMSQIEDLMQANPYAGLNAILQEIGPKRPDGSSPSLFEVAQFITQAGPEKWQQIVGARPQASNDQPKANPEVEQLKQQIEQLQTQQTTASVIEPFKASHPRWDELKDDIVMFLKSGRIPASLSPSDRLAAAYDMAERLNPPSNVDKPAPATSPDADGRADENLSGTKSIKSAPGSSSPDLAPQRGGSTADILRDEMRRRRAS
ncbi:hypothetical protein [Qipengyuania sp. MTN3-11]|uniref:hypothetical protein n=1 Tax=Qipengyuania sp. MTN3-11 TaxID=3056557 RepID=UPI0036F36C0E